MLAILARAAVLALGLLTPTLATASVLQNGDFEDTSAFLAGWTLSASEGIAEQDCALGVTGCAPGGGAIHAVLGFGGVSGASISQAADVTGPARLRFGATVSFGTNHAAGNFAQGQISITAQGTGISSTVGTDPNALAGQFTVPGLSGFSFTPWFDLVGELQLNAAGPFSILFNVNTQGATEAKSLILVVDNAFLTVEPLGVIPLPPALPLLGAGIAVLGLVGAAGRRRRLDRL